MNKILICLIISAQLITNLRATEEVCASSDVLAGGLLPRGGVAVRGVEGARRTTTGLAGTARATEAGAAERVTGGVATAKTAAAEQAESARVLAGGARVAADTLAEAARKIALEIVVTANSAENKIDAAATDSSSLVRRAAKSIDGVCTATIRDLQQTVDTIVLGLQQSVRKTTAELNVALDSAIIAIGSDLLEVIGTAEETVSRVGRNVASAIREGANDIARQVIATSVGVSDSFGRQSVVIAAMSEASRQDITQAEREMYSVAAAVDRHLKTGSPIIN